MPTYVTLKERQILILHVHIESSFGPMDDIRLVWAFRALDSTYATRTKTVKHVPRVQQIAQGETT